MVRLCLAHARTRAIAVVSLAIASHAAAAPPQYQLLGSFAVPDAALDVLPDGRLAAISGGAILFQTSPNGGVFDAAGSVDPGLVSPFGASFIRVSPDGSRIAIGDGNFGPGSSVLVLNTSDLSSGSNSIPAIFEVDNFDAAWLDTQTLFVSGGNAADSIVTRLDAVGGDTRVIINHVAGASGGVAVSTTHLFTSNGFDFDPSSGSETGEVRAFALADLGGPGPLDFEAVGIPVARALSGAPLALDPLGNLAIGGADFLGESGFAAAIAADDLAGAILSGVITPDGLETHLAPDPAAFSYRVLFNTFTNELILAADGVAYRYALVPAPGSVATMILLAPLAARRRRR